MRLGRSIERSERREVERVFLLGRGKICVSGLGGHIGCERLDYCWMVKDMLAGATYLLLCCGGAVFFFF